MTELRVFLASGALVRDSGLRRDGAAMQQALEHPDTRFVAVWQTCCMVASRSLALLTRDQLDAVWDPAQIIYLGHVNDGHRFAFLLPDGPPQQGFQDSVFTPLRRVLGELDGEAAALFAYAKGMAEWHQRHRYCGVCGAANRLEDGGFVMRCSAGHCGHRTFPRIDPAIIVLVIRGNRCLLGQQASWPEGRYSTIAGFAEPGETLEDTVRREVLEETDVRVGEIQYLGSQPWPFPSALMLGFHAHARSRRIRCTDGELADARWFSREDIMAGALCLPPPTSIAFRLIESWFDRTAPVPLASLGLSSGFMTAPSRPAA